MDANADYVVGVSGDSTVCVWNRNTGEFKDVFYHHRASVWGLRVQDGFAVTGSMDGTISVIELGETPRLLKHFLAHSASSWGVSDIDSAPGIIASGCLGKEISLWSLPDCGHLKTIETTHSVNCVSLKADEKIVVSSSRTGNQPNHNDGFKTANVIIWCTETGDALKELDVPSCCYVVIDKHKLLCLTAAGDAIIGEHHAIKWPIAKITIFFRGSDLNFESKSEMLIRYQRTPAIACTKTLLAYSLERTIGMCQVIDFWPTS